MNWSLEDIDSTKEISSSLVGGPRVVIASDVLLYREGLDASIRRDGRLQVIDVVHSHDLPDVIVQKHPEVVLLDAAMAHGLTLARTIRLRAPDIRIVGFGISGSTEQLIACAESGLTAFVDSEGSIDELVEAVRGALKGELTCSPQLAALLCERLATLASARDPSSQPLTRREHQVAMLIGEGLSNKEIAIDLKIGAATVKNHVHNILEKLKVRRRTAIAQQLGALHAGSGPRR